MYKAYFGLSENPFNLSPDPEFLYRSPQHEEALANLIYGVRSRKGFIVLAGEVGTGKTTMLECLRDYLDSQRIEFAFIFNSRLTPDQFFEMIAYDFDLRCDRKSKTEVLFALNALLIQQTERGRTCVLIVDEAHNLEWDVLEEIRLLGNLENRQGKLLQIILAGQPELETKLDAPNLRQLKQRIVLRCTLTPLTVEECIAYIETRMARAGMPNQRVFSQDLMHEIHHRSRGIPRIINAICDNLLVTCFAMEQRVATFAMLEEVSRDMRLEWPGSNRDRRPRSRYDLSEEPPSVSALGD
jgi:general secretion pathway protein A